MTKENLKIVFFGTPEFAVESLEALCKGGYDVAAVVTAPDKRAGRGHKLLASPVKLAAEALGLPVLQPEKLRDPQFLEELRRIDADLFIVIAFRMLPQVVWGMPRFGTFNLHGSLLPRYRGAAPINRAIMAGETRTGVTTFFLNQDIDTGNLIASRETFIGSDEDFGSLYNRMQKMGAELVLHTVDAIISGDGHVATTAQDENLACPAPKIFSDDCRIDWSRPRHEVRNMIRGLSPVPAAFTMLSNEKGETAKLKVYAATPSNLPCEGLAPGDVVVSRGELAVMCADALLSLTDIQLQGKKRMPASAFLLGYHPASHIPQQA